ncbi:hypothetical protein LCGC14_1748100 [marine sediment metagenome]|uniref:Calcineurin-like phosphoesterase domain-containing protein n=1 Tax=marine sediment metagenome TaxID=412755 RepID=A0A0F9HS24_9ZZZZ
MKFIYVQDTHIKGINPINRKGSYYEDIMAKLTEVLELANGNNVDYIIHGGDLFDSSNVSNIMVDEFIDEVEQTGIPFYIVPGNHDEIGHNWELSKSSSLAHIFRRSKLIKELTLLWDEGGVINGFKYYHNIEQTLAGEKGLICSHPNSPFKIATIHALITKAPLMPSIMHIPIKEVKTDFDVVLVAHNHLQWSIIEQNGTKFVNIGALGRTGIDEADITPTVALIDTETREIRLIPLKSAKPKEVVFDLEKVAQKKQFDGEIDKFISSLDSAKFQSLDLRGLIEFLSKKNNIEKEVKDEVIRRIGENE